MLMPFYVAGAALWVADLDFAAGGVLWTTLGWSARSGRLRPSLFAQLAQYFNSGRNTLGLVCGSCISWQAQYFVRVCAGTLLLWASTSGVVRV